MPRAVRSTIVASSRVTVAKSDSRALPRLVGYVRREPGCDVHGARPEAIATWQPSATMVNGDVELVTNWYTIGMAEKLVVMPSPRARIGEAAF